MTEHIAVVGPRASGKTWLTEAIALAFLQQSSRGLPGNVRLVRENDVRRPASGDDRAVIYDGFIPEGMPKLRVITLSEMAATTDTKLDDRAGRLDPPQEWLIPEGWYPWTGSGGMTPPFGHDEIELWRREWKQPARVCTRRIDPRLNTHELYWRPVAKPTEPSSEPAPPAAPEDELTKVDMPAGWVRAAWGGWHRPRSADEIDEELGRGHLASEPETPEPDAASGWGEGWPGRPLRDVKGGWSGMSPAEALSEFIERGEEAVKRRAEIIAQMRRDRGQKPSRTLEEIAATLVGRFIILDDGEGLEALQALVRPYEITVTLGPMA